MTAPSKSLTSWLVVVVLEWYYLLLLANSLASDPARHLNTGVHQQRGDCGLRAADLAGHMRQVYLCEETHTQVRLVAADKTTVLFLSGLVTRLR